MVLLYIGAIVIGVLMSLYIFRYLKRSVAFYHLDTDRKSGKIIIGIVSVALAVLLLSLQGIPSLIILYILLIGLLTDLTDLIIRKGSSKKKRPIRWDKLYSCGLIPVIISILVVTVGYFNMKSVVETDYHVATEKTVAPQGYEVALLSDIHYGGVIGKTGVRQVCSRVSIAKPDIVVLCGDIVDEGTTLAEMNEVFGMLGSIKSKYGIFFVYGNHDRQPYSSHPQYTEEQLESTIRDSGIKILSDETYDINDDLVLAGREDVGWEGSAKRKSINALLSKTDKSKFIMILDHQPADTENCADAGCDLQLSGHTHGGQIWPAGLFNTLTGTVNYGYEKSDDKYGIIVSSGVAGWRFPVRTSHHSEWIKVDLDSGK